MTSYARSPKSRDRVLRAFENDQVGPRRRPRKAAPTGAPKPTRTFGPDDFGPSRLPSAPKPQRSNPGFGNWRSSVWQGPTPNRRKRRPTGMAAKRASSAQLLP